MHYERTDKGKKARNENNSFLLFFGFPAFWNPETFGRKAKRKKKRLWSDGVKDIMAGSYL